MSYRYIDERYAGEATLTITEQSAYACVVNDGKKCHIHVPASERRRAAQALAGDEWKVVAAKQPEHIAPVFDQTCPKCAKVEAQSRAEPTDYTGYEFDETVAAVKYGQERGLRNELGWALIGVPVEPSADGELTADDARRIADTVMDKVQRHLDAAREQARADELRLAVASEWTEHGWAGITTAKGYQSWLLARADRIARQHAKGDDDE